MLPVLGPDAFVDDADGFARLGECIYAAVASSFENEKRVLEQQLKPLGLTLVEKGIDMVRFLYGIPIADPTQGRKLPVRLRGLPHSAPRWQC